MSEWPDFEIPETWSLTPIEELAETLRAGGTPSRKNKAYFDGGIPFAIIEDITGCGTYLDSTKQAITREGLEASSAWIVPEGSVLLSMYATIGATAINTIPVATNQAILAIVPKETCHPEFLCFCLQAHKRHLAQLNVESTQKNVNKGIVSSFRLPLPPLQEQKSIATILLAVQRAIDAQDRIIQTTTELKQALMQKLFSEGLRGEPQKETEIGLVPESWEVVRFEDSVNIKNGQVDPRRTPFAELLHVGPENIESNTGRLSSLLTNTELKISSGNYYFTPADILYSKIRPYLNKVALPDFEGTCSADMYPLRPSPRFTREFLFYYLLSDGFRKAAISFQDRTGIPKINRMQLGSIRLPCPLKEEQNEISVALAACDGKLGAAQEKRESLQNLFRTLLYELMSAKIKLHSNTFTESE